jgi:hypothetical protein
MQIIGRNLPQLQNEVSSGLNSVTQGLIQQTNAVAAQNLAQIKDSFMSEGLNATNLNPTSSIAPEAGFISPGIYFNQVANQSEKFTEISAALKDQNLRPESMVGNFAGSLHDLNAKIGSLSDSPGTQQGIIIIGGRFQPTPPPIMPDPPPIEPIFNQTPDPPPIKELGPNPPPIRELSPDPPPIHALLPEPPPIRNSMPAPPPIDVLQPSPPPILPSTAFSPDGPPIVPQTMLSDADQRAALTIGGIFMPNPPPIVPEGPPITPQPPPIRALIPNPPPIDTLNPTPPPISQAPEPPPIRIGDQLGPSPPPIAPADVFQSQLQVLRDMETTVQQSTNLYQQFSASMFNGRI